MLEKFSELLMSDHQKNFLVATSGGPDSMAMLDMLSKYTSHLIICHVNYKKRPESDNEQAMVAQFARDRGLIFEVEIADNFQKGNFQTWARYQRYHFFHRMYLKYNAKGLFVGHHLDDSIETYIWQSARQSIYKYAGIPPETTLLGMKVYRPLLTFYKRDLLEYCKQNHIPYAIDASNLTLDYTRNQIRHGIVAKFSDEEKKALIQSMEWENQQLSMVQQEVETVANQIIHGSRMDISSFLQIKPDIQRRLLHRFLAESILDIKKLSARFFDDIIRQIQSEKPNFQMRLDPRLVLAKEYDQLVVYNLDINQPYHYVIDQPGIQEMNGFLFLPHGEPSHGVAVVPDDYPLTLRSPLPFDEIQMGYGKKRLNRLFIDLKIPMRMRKYIPVLLNRDGVILLVVGYAKNSERRHMQSNFFVVK